MSYWTGDRVAKRLEFDPLVGMPDVEDLLRIVDGPVQVAEKAWPLEWYFLSARRKAYELALDRLHASGEVDTELLDEDSLGILAQNGLLGVVYRRMVQQRKVRKLFLEPTLAGAFSQTTVTGLTFADMGTIPGVTRIFVPAGAVMASEADGRSGHLSELVLLHGTHADKHMLDFVAVCRRDGNPSTGLMSSVWEAWDHTPLETGLCCGEYAEPADEPDDSGIGIVSGSSIYATFGRVAINTLLYLNSSSPDVLEKINPKYNDAFQRSQKARKKKERKKAQGSLKRLQGKKGYRHVGVHVETIQRRRMAKLAEEKKGEPGEAAEGRGGWHQVVHWHGNYWRQQPHGPGSKLRKLIYIEPYIKGSEPPKEKATRMKA